MIMDLLVFNRLFIVGISGSLLAAIRYRCGIVEGVRRFTCTRCRSENIYMPFC